MSELIVNASPMWHPTNGLDLTTYMKLPSSQRSEAYFDFEGNTPETSGFYIGLFIDGGQKKRYRINRLYAQNYFSSYEYRHCGIFYLDGSTYKLELCDNGGGSQNALLFYEYYIDTYNENTNTWTSQMAGSSTRSITLSMSSIYSNGCININNPYIPIFATNELVTAYLNDPEDETIYSQALNYYNPIGHSQPHYEMRRYFRGIDTSIENYINSMFDTDNSNYNNFIDEVLDPINNLVKSRTNMDYDTPINESLQKVKNSLTQVVNLKGMQLVNNPTESDTQVAFPNKVLTPLINFTPLTQEQLITIIDYFDNEKDVTADKGYFLTCHGYNTSNSCYEIYCCTFENKDNTHDYSNLYLEKTGTGSTVVRTKPEYYLQGGGIRIKKMSWGSCSIERYYYYPGTDAVTYSSSINEYVISNDKRYILLNKMNEDLPFYCSSDVYMAYRENDEDDWKNYLFLQKNSSEALEVVPVASALMHIKPIIMLYNRYQLSFLNGWDGNKMEMGDYYLIAPQLGAGIKEDDNSFSGVVMGTKLKDINQKDERLMGIFGQYHGRQSFFLNSDDGSAIFGLEKRGQITMDPTQNKAMIYSGNYWNNYKYDGKPSSYSDSNRSGQGMLIDLTTPEIRFGNGNFTVDKDGNTSIAGGGGLAGWKITDTTIHSGVPVANGRLVLDSGATFDHLDEHGNKIYTYSQAKIYSGSHNTLASTSAGFYLSDDGLSIGPSFKINTTGTFYIGYNATTFDCTNLNDPKHYTIGGSANSIYLGTEGIRLGNNFAVDNDGNIVTRHLVVSLKNGSTYDAIGCWIGDWQFASNSNGSYLSGVHQVSSNQWDRIWLSTEGIIKAEKWTQEPPSGTPEVMWQINPDGTASFKGSVTISNLGGFDIGGSTGNYITGGNIKANTIDASTIKINNVALSTYTTKIATSYSTSQIKDYYGNTVTVVTGVTLSDSKTLVTK